MGRVLTSEFGSSANKTVVTSEHSAVGDQRPVLVSSLRSERFCLGRIHGLQDSCITPQQSPRQLRGARIIKSCKAESTSPRRFVYGQSSAIHNQLLEQVEYEFVARNADAVTIGSNQ